MSCFTHLRGSGFEGEREGKNITSSKHHSMESLHTVLQSLYSSVCALCEDDLKTFYDFFVTRMLWLSSLHVMVPSNSTAFHTLESKGYFLPKKSFRTVKKEIQIVSIMLRQYLRSWKSVWIEKQKLSCSCVHFLEVCEIYMHLY